MTPSQFDIAFAVTGDIRFNSRALKQLKVLADEGYRVKAIGLAGKTLEEELFENVSLQLVPRPAEHGPAFFWRCHGLFKELISDVSANVYHASDLYNLPALAGAASNGNARLVYDARERYPYVAATKNRPWVSWFWGGVESHYIKRADVVFTVSRSIAAHMSASYNIELPDVLYNVPVFKEVMSSDVLRRELNIPAGLKIVLHQGKMQKDRGCLLLAEAMQYVTGAVLIFLGDGALRPAVQREVSRLGLKEQVLFKDAVTPAALHEYTCSADIGVTLLEDTCLNHRYALPNKLFEYLMAGLPVLGSDLPEIGRIIEEFDVGCVVYPEDPEEIARVLQGMINRPAQLETWSMASSKVFETFNWEAASQIFRRRYKNLISSPG